jgi:GntR family transcriptional repressor for pyruvate dehydrogenase complex
MTNVPLERVSLIDTLVERIESQIVSGEYPTGSRLPGEEVLAGQFGVSRPAVREGLSRLRERGYLETINGRGTYVRRPDADHLSASLLRQLRVGADEGYTVESLYEARSAIETTTAGLAATRAGEAHIRRLRQLLDDMDTHRGDASAYTAADLGFHIEVANAAHNPFLSALLQPLAKVIINGMLESSQTSPRAVDDGIRLHRIIFTCIAEGDSAGAAEAMRVHMDDSRRAFPGSVLGAQAPFGEDDRG